MNTTWSLVLIIAILSFLHYIVITNVITRFYHIMHFFCNNYRFHKNIHHISLFKYEPPTTHYLFINNFLITKNVYNARNVLSLLVIIIIISSYDFLIIPGVKRNNKYAKCNFLSFGNMTMKVRENRYILSTRKKWSKRKILIH